MGSLSIVKATGVTALVPNQRSNDNAHVSGWSGPGGLGTDDDLIDGLTTNPGIIFYQANNVAQLLSISFSFSDLDEPIYVLDGAPPVSFTDLPPGFIMRGVLKVVTNFSIINTSAAPVATARLGATLQETTVADPLAPNFSFTEIVETGFEITGDSLTFISGFQFSGKIMLMGSTSNSTGLGIPPGDVSAILQINGWSLEGEYAIFSFSWTITPDTASEGDEITISGIDPDDVISVESVKLRNPSNGDEIEAPITDSGPTFVKWRVPSGLDPDEDDFDILVEIIGTLFSGRVDAGTITILFVDASGIYSLTPGATADTLYDRTGTTRQVKIPNPFIKTGFIGG